MKLDKEQQKHFAEAIRNASKKKGFKVKGCSIYDDIFWKVLQMPSNSKQADSLRAVGAFKAPSILIEKGDRKSTRLNSSHANESRMPSSA